MAVDPQLFKDALAQWASGVSVATSLIHNDDAPSPAWKGTTVSSFISVSLNPPLVLISLGKHIYTHQVVADSGVYAVSILAANQGGVAQLFAGMRPEIEDRFAQNAWTTAETGCPILQSALAWVDTRVLHAYDGGDHTLFVGEVVAAGRSSAQAEPLLYHNRRWGHFSADA